MTSTISPLLKTQTENHLAVLELAGISILPDLKAETQGSSSFPPANATLLMN